MNYPDPTPPSYPLIPSPFAGADGGGSSGYWPGIWTGNDQQQQQPDLMSQFDCPPYKRPRISEKPPNFAPPPQTNPRINPPNVAGNKGTSHIFFKTRFCSKFDKGNCPNGDQCSFAHGPDDLRQPPPNWQDLIREKDRGSGNSSWGGSGGDDRRMMIHRMKICKKFYNGEECPYGDKCNFLHERPSSPPPPPMKKFKIDDMPEQRESSAINVGITNNARGNGGDFDNNNKVFWKTRLCSKWEMGQCPFGDRCHYAHGQSELKFHGTVGDSAPVTDAVSIPRKPAPISAYTAPPANLVVAIPSNGDEEHNRLSKWKATKKINRIYADWLDDMTPPRYSPSKEEM